MNDTENQKELLLQALNERLVEHPFISFDDSIKLESINNRLKEFWVGEPIWEDVSEEDIELENLSVSDIEYIIEQVDLQIQNDSL